jgi:HlyD family secretion protein
MALFRSIMRWMTWILLSAILVACSPTTSQSWSGYVVGDYVYMSSALAGRLKKIAVVAGDAVQAGEGLFDLDADLETYTKDESVARLSNARSLAADADKGKRAQEIEVIQSQLEQAQAGEGLSQQNLERQEKLLEQGFVSKATVDDAKLNLKQSVAKVAELQASLSVANLPARWDERQASQANAQAAQEVLQQNAWRESQKHVNSAVNAVVADVFFRLGEWIPAGQPVLSLLPAENIKIRFYIEETALPQIQVGQTVQIHCDGCAKDIEAKISRLATQAEYTPPVIYSNEQRAKLVYMVEARPTPADAALFRTGQPVQVRLMKKAQSS